VALALLMIVCLSKRARVVDRVRCLIFAFYYDGEAKDKDGVITKSDVEMIFQPQLPTHQHSFLMPNRSNSWILKRIPTTELKTIDVGT
jgi:hypothetical protein